MDRYIALLHAGPEGYGVLFPDFPGCVSAGDTIDDALGGAGEALSAHVDLMRHDGETIPAPRSLEDIKAAKEDWIEWEGAIVAVVPLLPPPARSVRLNISMDESLVAAIDAAAEARGTSRSGFLADAARQSLGHV